MSRIARVIRTDDRIYGVRGRWYEANGMVLWIAFHYDVLLIFGVVASITFLLSLAGGALVSNALFYAVAFGVLASYWMADQLSKDRGLKGLLMIQRNQLATWWAQRKINVTHRRDTTPQTVTLRKVKR